MDARLLFQATFRFLAETILIDRGHEAAANWTTGGIDDVLHGIDRYYRLGAIKPSAPDRLRLELLGAALAEASISATLRLATTAFVYENTFVTSEARAELGTHSTPRQMAEHIVRRKLQLWGNLDRIQIYEPFTGAGILLVAALRQLRAALPLEWSDAERHEFLTARLSGDEVDEFACEVAELSLILADYPNHNGWDIRQANLFANRRLRERITPNTYVICNPPFQDFEPDDRATALGQHDVSKPVAILTEVIAAEPAGIGFVLPSTFILGERYRRVRALLEQTYRSVEIVETLRCVRGITCGRFAADCQGSDVPQLMSPSSRSRRVR